MTRARIHCTRCRRALHGALDGDGCIRCACGAWQAVRPADRAIVEGQTEIDWGLSDEEDPIYGPAARV